MRAPYGGRAPLSLTLFSVWWLAGCSMLNAPIELAEIAPEPTRLDDVPFFPQSDYQCGPASLASVLADSGVAVTPDELRAQVYLPERRGSLQVELLGAARRAGRIAFPIDRTPEAMLAELRAGRPVLVMQNLLTPGFPRWHYAVVVGHDPGQGTILLHSGREEYRAERATRFLRRWDWAGRWGFVALSPGELPASGESARYAEAVAAFEGVAGKAAAEPAWLAALERWPDDPRPRLALGNAAYAAGQHETAVRYYLEGLARDPDDAVLRNNLASVLGELGCARAAESVLLPVATTLPDDSPWRARVDATAAELGARRGADPERCVALAPRAKARATASAAGPPRR